MENSEVRIRACSKKYNNNVQNRVEKIILNVVGLF